MIFPDPMDWTWTNDASAPGPSGQSPRPSSLRYRYHVSMRAVNTLLFWLFLNG